ncbi:MAG TPA: TolC family protein [Gemmataceae bacterium]|nr:TolC family protein [Gemmataceae bacterium]
MTGVTGALAAALALTPAAYSQSPPPPARAAVTTVVQAVPPADTGAAATAAHPPAVARLTLDEAKSRVLANSKLLALAATNVEGKGYATKALRANYFPQVIGNTVYFHFNDDLGTVLTTQGRHVTGPRGKPLGIVPSFTINLPVLNQDTSFSTVAAVQPLTALLKVRAGVKAARADEEIAQAQLEKGRRALINGTQQLFWGLLAVQRIRAGAAEAVAAAEKMAASPQAPVEVRLALAEARQAVQQVDAQLADLQEQMDLLLDLPTCTLLELVEPPVPVVTVRCADEAVQLALAASPDVREAELNVVRAQAGVKAAKVDYLPNVVIMGGYLNQTAADYIQPNVGYVGVMGSYTFLDWGKRKNTIREAETTVALASLKVRTTQDDVRKKALKAFRDLDQTQAAINTARELVELRAEAVKKATTPAALKDPEPLLRASKKLGEAQVDLVKAELAYRTAWAQFMELIGDH